MGADDGPRRHLEKLSGAKSISQRVRVCYRQEVKNKSRRLENQGKIITQFIGKKRTVGGGNESEGREGGHGRKRKWLLSFETL